MFLFVCLFFSFLFLTKTDGKFAPVRQSAWNLKQHEKTTGMPKYNESIGLDGTNNRATRAACVLLHFLDVFYKITWSLSKDKGNGKDNARNR